MDLNAHLNAERFLSGQMSAAEAEEFLAAVESDPSLRMMLEAERLVNKSIHREKQVLMNHDLSHAATVFVAGLAATATIGTASAAAATAQVATITKSSGISALQLALSTAVSVAVTGAGFWIAGHYQSENTQSIAHTPIIEVQQIAPEFSLPIPPEVKDKPVLAVQSTVKASVKPANTQEIEVFHSLYNNDTVRKVRLENSHSRFRSPEQE
jgi:hypothetical protein